MIESKDYFKIICFSKLEKLIKTLYRTKVKSDFEMYIRKHYNSDLLKVN